MLNLINWNRGFFRAWLVLLIGSLFFTYAIFADEIYKEFKNLTIDLATIDHGSRADLDLLFTDDEMEQLMLEKARARIRSKEKDNSLQQFRATDYYRSLDDEQLSGDVEYNKQKNLIYMKAQNRIRDNAQPWKLILRISLLNIAVFVLLFLSAKSIGWVINGFKRDPAS